MNIDTQQSSKNAISIASPTPTPAEVVELTSKIEPLKARAGQLDTANLITLYLAGIIAVAIALISFWNSRVNRNLRALEGELGKVKDALVEQEDLRLRTDLENATKESRAQQAELTKEQGKLASEQRKTAQEQGKLVEAQRKTAEAQQAAAEAQKALAEVVERRTAARHLTPEQRAQLIGFLQANPKGEVWIATQGDDNDANTFGLELSEAIGTGGWKISRSSDIGIQYRPGLMLAVHSLATQGANAGFLQKALTLIGFPPIAIEDARQVQKGQLKLIVGPRPK